MPCCKVLGLSTACNPALVVLVPLLFLQVIALTNLMADWKEHVTEGKKFFYNARTKESVWILPAEVQQQVCNLLRNDGSLFRQQPGACHSTCFICPSIACHILLQHALCMQPATAQAAFFKHIQPDNPQAVQDCKHFDSDGNMICL